MNISNFINIAKHQGIDLSYNDVRSKILENPKHLVSLRHYFTYEIENDIELQNKVFEIEDFNTLREILSRYVFMFSPENYIKLFDMGLNNVIDIDYDKPVIQIIDYLFANLDKEYAKSNIRDIIKFSDKSNIQYICDNYKNEFIEIYIPQETIQESDILMSFYIRFCDELHHSHEVFEIDFAKILKFNPSNQFIKRFIKMKKSPEMMYVFSLLSNETIKEIKTDRDIKWLHDQFGDFKNMSFNTLMSNMHPLLLINKDCLKRIGLLKKFPNKITSLKNKYWTTLLLHEDITDKVFSQLQQHKIECNYDLSNYFRCKLTPDNIKKIIETQGIYSICYIDDIQKYVEPKEYIKEIKCT